jgi:hypothetical protein
MLKVREMERQREIYRQAGRQTDWLAGRQTDNRQIDKQTLNQTDRHRQTQTETDRDRQTNREA